MIKLNDFAKQQGVTDRAIQKHLKTYADELEGLYERKGANGTWLTDEACEILRGKMKQQPVIVGDSDLHERYETLLEENRELLKALNTAKDVIIDLQGSQALLEARDKEVKLLEGFIADAKAEIKVQNGENERLMSERDELIKRVAHGEAQRANLSDENELLRAEALEAHKTAENVSNELTGYKRDFLTIYKKLEDTKAELETVKKANLWQRIKGWKR